MSLIENIKSHKKQLLFILILILSKSLIQLFEFPNSLKFSLLRASLFLIALIIALIFIKNWKFKLITILFIVVFSIFQGELNIWKIPAKKYVNSIETEHKEAYNFLISQQTIQSVSSNSKREILLNHKQSDTFHISEFHKKEIKKLILSTEIKEIEKNDLGVLFILSRFIDNGYGLFYVTNKDFINKFQSEIININGLQITGISKISDSWYRVSFT